MFTQGNRGNTLHGILLIALFSFSAFYIAEIPFVKSLSFSPLITVCVIVCRKLGFLVLSSVLNRCYDGVSFFMDFV